MSKISDPNKFPKILDEDPCTFEKGVISLGVARTSLFAVYGGVTLEWETQRKHSLSVCKYLNHKSVIKLSAHSHIT